MPSRGSCRPVGKETSPSPYMLESLGSRVLSSMYWSLNMNLNRKPQQQQEQSPGWRSKGAGKARMRPTGTPVAAANGFGESCCAVPCRLLVCLSQCGRSYVLTLEPPCIGMLLLLVVCIGLSGHCCNIPARARHAHPRCCSCTPNNRLLPSMLKLFSRSCPPLLLITCVHLCQRWAAGYCGG